MCIYICMYYIYIYIYIYTHTHTCTYMYICVYKYCVSTRGVPHMTRFWMQAHVIAFAFVGIGAAGGARLYAANAPAWGGTPRLFSRQMWARMGGVLGVGVVVAQVALHCGRM